MQHFSYKHVFISREDNRVDPDQMAYFDLGIICEYAEHMFWLRNKNYIF